MNNPTYKPEGMEDFWRFVFERQRIWYRRFQLKRPPPWTKNKILTDYFFTNMFRELDPGTIFFKEEVMAKCPGPREVLFNLLVYRLFNQELTYKFLVQYAGDPSGTLPLQGWKHKRVALRLQEYDRQLKAEGSLQKVFTGAFTVTGVRFGGYEVKINNISWLVEHLQGQIPATYRRLRHAQSLEETFKVFKSLKGFGAFLAYEATIDWNYYTQRFSENDFVNAGPGCQAGLKYIFPNRDELGFVDQIKWLQSHQRSLLKQYDLWWPFLDVCPGYILTLRNVEHSLCEFSKYQRINTRVTPQGLPSRATTRRYVVPPKS